MNSVQPCPNSRISQETLGTAVRRSLIESEKTAMNLVTERVILKRKKGTQATSSTRTGLARLQGGDENGLHNFPIQKENVVSAQKEEV